MHITTMTDLKQRIFMMSLGLGIFMVVLVHIAEGELVGGIWLQIVIGMHSPAGRRLILMLLLLMGL
jgi:hypothetical protein